MDSLTQVVTWVFMVANMGRLLAYLPQIHAAATCRNGATGVSRMTWGYFGVAHLAGAVYGLKVAQDFKMVVVFSSNFVACAMVVGLVTWKKRSLARRLAGERAAQAAFLADEGSRPAAAFQGDNRAVPVPTLPPTPARTSRPLREFSQV
jgi:hypothetical protein